MLECVIVGGGIHGTYLAQRLLEETHLQREDVLIVDPNEQLLASFRRKARACDMEGLRSTFVHHVGTDPFGLESFAEGQDREDELLSTQGYPRRPSLSLFLDYADDVIARTDLSALHRRAAVRSIDRPADETGLVLETTDSSSYNSVDAPSDAVDERIHVRTCVFAIGHGGRYHRPAWAQDLEAIAHVWDGDGAPEETDGETIVVGGGITAAQLALCLCEGDDVTLLSRGELEEAAIEADPRWINWNHTDSQLHRYPPGSQTRYETVREARNDGTVPPRLAERLESAREADELTIRHGEVRSARTVAGRVRLLLAKGGYCSGDRVVLATGFEPVFEHPFVDRVADSLALERGYRGMPVLDDETLAWRDERGNASPVYVTGALAAGTVGPLAGNIAGARRAADRITGALECRPRRPAPAVSTNV
ncbi:thioredoxin reductase [Salinadaptatus halalkaliphilus]|uniref:Thioredoxin reductase n=1 Tax=Salinadaptatus halalkaliphilus TaxID=2419781 RepID=A0A4S3TQU5_9EURY|nr:FAD/NAD(P)-binding protein [Salinadaptatus halalkaliphilus]THE66762.1 thioredoxin reductase [Salinadaptatus halalkaliphilus]